MDIAKMWQRVLMMLMQWRRCGSSGGAGNSNSTAISRGEAFGRAIVLLDLDFYIRMLRLPRYRNAFALSRDRLYQCDCYSSCQVEGEAFGK